MKTRSWQRGFMLFGVFGVMVMVVLSKLLVILASPIIIIGVLGMLMMVVIRNILAKLVFPEVISLTNAALEITAKQDIASLMQALKLYRLDNQRYPVTEQGLQALARLPTTAPFPPHWKAGGYVEFLPKDPWGNPYQYLSPGVRGEVDIFSLGADDAPGGEGNDTDIRLLANQG